MNILTINTDIIPTEYGYGESYTHLLPKRTLFSFKKHEVAKNTIKWFMDGIQQFIIIFQNLNKTY